MKTILQVPLDKQLKSSAEKAANEQGFSSLQELIRVFLAKVASNKIEIRLEESTPLSLKNEKRYEKMTKDFHSGKNIDSAGGVEELLSKLDDYKVS